MTVTLPSLQKLLKWPRILKMTLSNGASHASSRSTPHLFELIPSQVSRDNLSLNPAGHTQYSSPEDWWAGSNTPDLSHGLADTFPHCLGDSCDPLPDDQVRFLFGNINGLQLRDEGARLRQILREINMLQAHHTGLAEINANTRHSTVLKLLYDVAKDEFLHSVLTHAHSQVDCRSMFKPGGVLSVTKDEFVGRIMDKGSDHMGRWSFVKYAGKAGKVITVVTAYQVCVRPTNEVGNTAFHQQVQHIATEAQQSGITISAPQPRLRFRTDLLRFLHELKRSGESIILMGDFNKDIGESRSKLQRLFQDDRLKMVDIIGRQHPSTLALPTYIRGSKRLDFILITEDLIPAVRRCGYLPFHDHFRSDHRFAFIDFDHDILFGPSEAQLAPHMFREFRSNDPKQVEKYLLLKCRLLQDSNFFPRLQTLCDSDEPDHHLAEKLDACWVHASLTAAKHCKKRRREWWSIPLHQALEEKSLLQTHLTGLRTGHDFSKIIDRRLQEFNLPDLVLPDTISETNAALKQVQLRIKQIRANSKSVREQSLIEQAREIRYMQKKSDAEILEILKKKELQAARWQKIGFLQGKNRSSQFTKVEVPLSWPCTQEEFLNPDHIIENPKDCLLWRSIEDPSEVEFYIQMRNRLHFGQAQGTPFTTGSLQDDINWGASSPGAESVLLGRYRVDPAEYCTFDDNEEESPQAELLREFLAACNRSPEQRTRPLIMPEVSLEELIGRIKVWNERTTTSPSGLHLGHLKSLTARLPSPEADPDDNSDPDSRSDAPTSASAQKQLLHAQLQLINYGLKHGYAYKRWKNVVNVMIQKETGNNKIHRLRVIHLYEADLGATFAILWKKMFASAESYHDINDSQYGGRHGHEAAYLPYAEELKYDLCRLSRKPLVNFDNDAQSCYDRIIPSIVPGTDLRLQWPCYFEHASNLLYRRHPTDDSLFFRLHPTTDLDQEVFVTSDDATSWSPTRSCVPVFFFDSPPDVNSSAARCVVVVGGVAQGCSAPASPVPPPSRSFLDYVQTLPLSERQLLSELDISIPLDDPLDVFRMTSTANAKCYGVSDGSEASGCMTFGWVMAASDGTRVVQCAGPAFGYQASSYRAEGYGFVSMALFLFHLCHFSSAVPDWKFTFVSDNLGLVTKTSQSWDYDFPFPNLTLSPDYDLIHETVMSLRQARVHTSFSHVKGHQDTSKTPFASLPLPAQLNIEADGLAGSYRRDTADQPHPRVPLLSHTRCILHLEAEGTITRSYTTSLRTHAATPDLQAYMMKRFHWSGDTLQSIDWTVFSRCQSKLQHAHRQLIKFGFDILPTSAVEARRNPAATPTCPLCKSVSVFLWSGDGQTIYMLS